MPPTVSCIMPTLPSRRHFLRQGIRYFQQQTYEERQLVIVDDDDGNGVPSFLPNAPNIVYLTVPPKTTIGTKLNIGIEASAGAIIQRMDDDDFYHPDFVSTLSSRLVARNVDNAIYTINSFLMYLTQQDLLKRVNGWWMGGTMCFRRTLWEQTKFRDYLIGEDKQFSLDSKARMFGLNAPHLYMYIKHNNNTFGWESFETHFDKAPQGQLHERLSAENTAFYRSLTKHTP